MNKPRCGRHSGRPALFVLALCLCLACAGCALFTPLPAPSTLAQRLADIPTQGVPLAGQASIRFNRFQVPFIQAEKDEDLPFLLGLVQAHLRLGQMELLKRASQGRLAEMAGPLAIDLDRALRILDLGRAAGEMEAKLPPATRAWVGRFVRGINFYRRHAARLPADLKILGIGPEPWTVRDVLVLGRLIAADVNWLYRYQALRVWREPAFPLVWRRLLAGNGTAAPAPSGPAAGLAHFSKSGSNAWALAGQRTASGAGLLASDPHLGLILPNLWLVAGLSSPSHHLVGLFFPGLPAAVIGRNRHIAWGGTNLLALSSTFYDVSSPDFRPYEERRQTIKVRWWWDAQVTVRQSRLGPLVSDAPLLKDILPRPTALYWLGHRPSDELTAFLKVMSASNWREFRAAFAGYAVSGQNFVYADKAGNVGRLMALAFDPAAGRNAAGLVADPTRAGNLPGKPLAATELPALFNPPLGLVASANDAPFRAQQPFSLFGGPNGRLGVIRSRLAGLEKATVKDMMRLQADVYGRAAHGLAQALAPRLVAIAQQGPRRELARALAAWDGRYGVESAGAAALELLAFHLAKDLYTELYGEKLARYLLASPKVYTLLREDLAAGRLAPHLAAGLEKAAAAWAQNPAWGKLHSLVLQHPLGNLPLLGARFRFARLPWPGSSNTVCKSAHALSGGPHRVTYGSNARFVTDLSSPDENYFVLLGGQDGFFHGENFLDMLPLWQKGSYLRIPLSAAGVARAFPLVRRFKSSRVR